MDIIKDKTGTYSRRLWFEDGEIEAIAEKHRRDFIQFIGEPDTLALPVDHFVEIHLPKVLNTEIVFDPYADLRSAEGPQVLGVTYFHNDRLEVKIDSLITQGAERSGQWGRYNATAIHEAGHCAEHRVLFEHDPKQEELFRAPSSNRIACLQRTIEGYYTGEWWEYQANQFMANVLMPRELFREMFKQERDFWSEHDDESLVEDYHVFDSVLERVGEIFQVSKQAVRIRLHELNLIHDPHQAELFNSSQLHLGDVLTHG